MVGHQPPCVVPPRLHKCNVNWTIYLAKMLRVWDGEQTSLTHPLTVKGLKLTTTNYNPIGEKLPPHGLTVLFFSSTSYLDFHSQNHDLKGCTQTPHETPTNTSLSCFTDSVTFWECLRGDRQNAAQVFLENALCLFCRRRYEVIGH